MHQLNRNWTDFRGDFEENRNPQSGSRVKLRINHPRLDFLDYYWTESDYKECFDFSFLELIQIYHPLGNKGEQYDWKDELEISPIVIFLAKKRI